MSKNVSEVYSETPLKVLPLALRYSDQEALVIRHKGVMSMSGIDNNHINDNSNSKDLPSCLFVCFPFDENFQLQMQEKTDKYDHLDCYRYRTGVLNCK